jgi:hypothetical protein
VFKNEVQIFIVHGRAYQIYNKMVLDLVEQFLFPEYVPRFAQLTYLFLVDRLYGHQITSRLVPRQDDPSVGTLSNNFAKLIISNANFSALT